MYCVVVVKQDDYYRQVKSMENICILMIIFEYIHVFRWNNWGGGGGEKNGKKKKMRDGV